MRRPATAVPAALAAVAALALVAGCSSSSTTDPGGNNGGGQYGMSATINGHAWAAAAKPGVVFHNTILSIAGLDLVYGVTITVGQLTTTGTYSLAYLNTQASSAIVSYNGGGWDTFYPNGTGSVTITTLTANHIVGTFSFTAIAGTGTATGTMVVTNGVFDVTY